VPATNVALLELTGAVKLHECGDALHTVLGRDRILPVAVFERHREEAHGSVVLVEGSLITVRTHENDGGLVLLGAFSVGIRELGGVATARGAPVGREVDEDGVNAGKCLGGGLFAW
jgi:hypothetical protein